MHNEDVETKPSPATIGRIVEFHPPGDYALPNLAETCPAIVVGVNDPDENKSGYNLNLRLFMDSPPRNVEHQTSVPYIGDGDWGWDWPKKVYPRVSPISDKSGADMANERSEPLPKPSKEIEGTADPQTGDGTEQGP